MWFKDTFGTSNKCIMQGSTGKELHFVLPVAFLLLAVPPQHPWQPGILQGLHSKAGTAAWCCHILALTQRDLTVCMGGVQLGSDTIPKLFQ